MDTKHAHGEKYEKSDLHLKPVWSFAWSLLGLMFAGLFAAFLIFAGYAKLWEVQDRNHQPSRLAASLPAHPPEPRLQEVPAQDLKSFRERENQAAQSYGWVEPSAGVVRIPVERAMELLLKRGLPVRAAGAAESGAEKAAPAPEKKR